MYKGNGIGSKKLVALHAANARVKEICVAPYRGCRLGFVDDETLPGGRPMRQRHFRPGSHGWWEGASNHASYLQLHRIFYSSMPLFHWKNQALVSGRGQPTLLQRLGVENTLGCVRGLSSPCLLFVEPQRAAMPWLTRPYYIPRLIPGLSLADIFPP